jgi:predicted O-linked N-acetylglucosamine transferase (SPINDLY family)
MNSRKLDQRKKKAPSPQEINMLVTLSTQGRYAEAATLAQKITVRFPQHGYAWMILGMVLKRMGRGVAALAATQKAAALSPNVVEVQFSLGVALQEFGQLDEAEASYRRALKIKPDLAQAHCNLGNVLIALRRVDEAEASYRRALQIKADSAEIHNNLGQTLKELGRLSEAEASYRRALQIKPDWAGVHNSLGETLKELGRLDEAEASYRRALQIEPDYAEAHSNLLLALNYQPGKLDEAVLRAHQEYEVHFGIPHRAKWPLHSRRLAGLETDRPLKVGYVSPDLRRHSVAYFVQPLLREHDPQAVEVFCYAEVAQPDAVTSTLQGFTNHWLSTVGLSDAALAERIVADKIDILVDLAGHTARNRLQVFARKPAPVQITWLGYPNTTGLSAMDYRLVDAVTDPPGETDHGASETLIRLDNGFLCYEPPPDAPLPAAPPGLASGSITFGSFNNPAKLSSATFDAWAILLDRVPGSRLLLKGRCFSEDASRTAFLTRLVQRGVDPKRVTLLGFVQGLAHHLSVYEQVDIALDPFPYNGTTTTCEALWMGVPVVTLTGDRHAGRVGASLLTQVGLTELIAPSVEAYIDIASTLAADPPRLGALRQNMRERLRTSPLCAPQAFARKIEATYRDLWRRHCATVDANQ